MGIDDSAEKLAIEIDWESTNPQTNNKMLNDGSVEANSNKRSGIDRRVFKYTIHVPERRSGLDRRDTGWYRN